MKTLIDQLQDLFSAQREELRVNTNISKEEYGIASLTNQELELRVLYLLIGRDATFDLKHKVAA